VDYPALRRQQLGSCLGQEGVDALLITNPINVTYLTGFSGESSFLVLGAARTVLVSDTRFTQQLAEECPGLEVHIRTAAQTVLQATADVLAKLGHRSVGLESDHLTLGEADQLRQLAPALSWKPGSGRVEQLRVFKDASEVAAIREAIYIAERAFTAFRAFLLPDDTEKELADRLEQYVRRFGGRCTSFPSIVAMGPRAALPHAPPTSRTLSDGELLLVDWGASGCFYKSDLTRVLVPRKNSPFTQPIAGGSLPPRLEEIYTVVLRAQQRALELLRPGAKAQEVDAEARRVIAEAGFGDFFGHGLGHGIGLQVHEAPSLRPNSNHVLQAGMVVTVEPGIYLPNWGGVRIEDDVLITPDGYEVLTSVPRDLGSSLCDL
jgi:Xaa-Pro aminopeptidase